MAAMTDHPESHQATLEDAYEWVNAWAAQAAASVNGHGGEVPGPAEAVERAGRAEAELTDVRASPPVVPQWANLLRLVGRAEAPAARLRKAAAFEARLQSLGRESRNSEESHASEASTLEAQIERDIADIRAAWERLSSEPAQGRRRQVRRLEVVKTSDYVPIMVGGMLAFTALVVFGAAASFVTFR